MHGVRTCLFIDEVHRFNKAQQDLLLPVTESGEIVLIGATTENPYFEVNAALMSRTSLWRLQPHSRDSLSALLDRGLEARNAAILKRNFAADPRVMVPGVVEELTRRRVLVLEYMEGTRIDRLHERLAGRTFVAHNVRFDYGFLRHEFERAGIRWTARTLCTVKLSRRLYPQHHRHNLDTLIERHGLAAQGIGPCQRLGIDRLAGQGRRRGRGKRQGEQGQGQPQGAGRAAVAIDRKSVV